MFRRRPILFPRRIWRRRLLRPGCLFWLLSMLAVAFILGASSLNFPAMCAKKMKPNPPW